MDIEARIDEIRELLEAALNQVSVLEKELRKATIVTPREREALTKPEPHPEQARIHGMDEAARRVRVREDAKKARSYLGDLRKAALRGVKSREDR